ncbi:MAG: hypothetical protein ACT4QA_16705 [Panacagrimonas sp.]
MEHFKNRRASERKGTQKARTKGRRKPAAGRSDLAAGDNAAEGEDAAAACYGAADKDEPFVFEDDRPGWSLEGDQEEYRLGLRNSRPLDVYRHTEYPEFKQAITDTIDALFRHELERAASLDTAGVGANRVSNRTTTTKDGGIGSGMPACSPTGSLPALPLPALLVHLRFGSGQTAKANYQKLRNHLRLVLLDAYISHHQDPAQWVGYSRNDEKYLGQKSRYNRLRLSRQFLTQAVDLLAGNDFLESWVSKPGWSALQSRFRPTALLSDMLRAIPVNAIEQDYSVRESIVLKGEKDPVTKIAPFIEYDDEEEGDQPRRWRDNLAIINKQIASSTLGITLDAATLKRLRINFEHKHLYRVFNNGDWNQGGRFYGGWWIGLKNREPYHFRRHITIDGKPVVEVDYSQIHPTFLYATAGVHTIERRGVRVAVPGEGLKVPADSYTIDGLDRGDAKTVFNTMLNVRSPKGIFQAVRNAAIEDEREDARQKAQLAGIEYVEPDATHRIAAYTRCIQPILQAHPGIADAFGTGIGLLLQNKDSQMAEAVMLELAGSGITVLPVHDSFIVRAEYEGMLLTIMDTVLHDFFPELRELSDGLNFKVTYADGTTARKRSLVQRQA